MICSEKNLICEVYNLAVWLFVLKFAIMFRSPTTKKAPFEYPSGKLGSVTRKKNEILAIHDRADLTKNEIFDLISQYEEKLATFMQACREIQENGDLINNHPEEINSFKLWFKNVETTSTIPFESTILQIRQRFREIDNINSGQKDKNLNKSQADGFSTRTTSSRRSSVRSSLRLKLIDEKAKQVAEQEALKAKRTLDRQIIKENAERELKRKELENKYKEIELKKNSTYIRI